MAIHEVDLDYDDFNKLFRNFLTSSGIPSELIPALHKKLSNEEFDAGNYFLLTYDEEDESILHPIVSDEDGLKKLDPNCIFLIDHAWTYEAKDARKQLFENQDLLSRMAKIVGADCPDVDDVLKKLWLKNQTYSLPYEGSKKVLSPVWYVLDEFGSTIRHSDDANVAMFPFFYPPHQTSYSIMWLLKDLKLGDKLVRDFANNEKDPSIRKCVLLPWYPQDLTDIDSSSKVVPEQIFEERFSHETTPLEVPRITKSTPLKVYLEGYQPGLTDTTSFTFVDDVKDADVLWTMNIIKDYKSFSDSHPSLLINQFPCEQLLLNKHFFAAVSSSSGEEEPAWLPKTFNLQTELLQFISYYQQEAKLNESANVWICKPWNLARGLQIQVTNDLNEIIRLRETSTPMIVSKYIEDPVLYHRNDINSDVKFTYRVYVLLKSVLPLKLFASKLTRLHFANKQFELKDFDEYERHFTVMNYFQRGESLKEISLTEFASNFNHQNPDQNWNKILKSTYTCIQQFFLSATKCPPPYGLGHYNNSRALYAVDVMLKWNKTTPAEGRSLQPMLLECNFLPDCSQTYNTDSDFMNKVFKFLFTEADATECDMEDITP